MQPLTGLRRDTNAPRRDPAPSRLGYRYQRLMLTPGFRAGIRIGLPVFLILVIASVWFSNPANRENLDTAVAGIRTSIEQRPEFLVSGLEIEGGDDQIAAEVRGVLPLKFPISSFDLDLAAMRETVQGVPAVRSAVLRIRPGGTLIVTVTPRDPVAVLRQQDGLALIDLEGVVVRHLADRSERADLPLVAGDGAKAAIGEALSLYAAAGPIVDKVRGLVRMGERRWDVVLEGDKRVFLPAQNAVRAFERVVVMAETQDLLDRDISVVDMRNEDRPTLRLGAEAAARMRQINASVSGAGQ